jgi:hypothetical protein
LEHSVGVWHPVHEFWIQPHVRHDEEEDIPNDIGKVKPKPRPYLIYFA